jgi:hypothetical protein
MECFAAHICNLYYFKFAEIMISPGLRCCVFYRVDKFFVSNLFHIEQNLAIR